MPLSLRIPPEKEEMIRKAAAKAGKTKTAYILEAVDVKLARIFHEFVLNRVFLGSGWSNCKVKKPIYVGIKKDFR